MLLSLLAKLVDYLFIFRHFNIYIRLKSEEQLIILSRCNFPHQIFSLFFAPRASLQFF